MYCGQNLEIRDTLENNILCLFSGLVSTFYATPNGDCTDQVKTHEEIWQKKNKHKNSIV